MAGMIGKLCGDNMANSAELSDKEAKELAREAHEFVTKYMAALFGLKNTTLLHRLPYHLLDKLRLRGNIFQADTSTNEMLHKLCKFMYARTNKQEEEYDLRLLWAEQALAFFVGEMREKSTEAAIICERHGLFSFPDSTPRTAPERHRERFFVNAFYPSTSNGLAADSRA